MTNTYAMRAQRFSSKDGLDYYPTPPWATRAFIENIIKDKHDLNKQTCLEPACGGGYMSRALLEYFQHVDSYDINDYGYGNVRNFLCEPFDENSYDWVITNPPFNLAKEFIIEALRVSRIGVAMLARTTFLESVGRYNDLFKNNPPSIFAQYVERVPMVNGRLDKKATTATGYAWFIWDNREDNVSQLKWIPPSRKLYEKDSDYEPLVR